MQFRTLLFLSTLTAGLLLAGCRKDQLSPATSTEITKANRLDIGIDEILKYADVETLVTPRSHGYLASARGRGTIPSGEYAGWNFRIDLEALYSGVGTTTLETGSASVRIRGERFESVSDPLLQSFCCGEGDLMFSGGEWIFSMFGQVVHATASPPHNHLFAGLASTAGTMNMNIADQSGTVVEPADPPHDPGIGLIIGFYAQSVEVIEH